MSLFWKKKMVNKNTSKMQVGDCQKFDLAKCGKHQNFYFVNFNTLKMNNGSICQVNRRWVITESCLPECDSAGRTGRGFIHRVFWFNYVFNQDAGHIRQ